MNKTSKIERSVAIPRAKLHPNPWNPNKTKPRQQAAIAESLATYGQVLELVVRPHPNYPGEYQIIDGEHRYNELTDTVFATVLHDFKDDDAKKLTIILNETRGQADKIELAQLLADISLTMADETIVGLPYEQKELAELIGLADMDWDSFGNGESESDRESESGSEDGDGDETGSNLVTINFKVARYTQDLFQRAKTQMGDRMILSQDPATANGQILEVLVDEYRGVSR